MARIIMIHESKWTVINRQAEDTHVICVKHAEEKMNTLIYKLR